mgnify:CR=1 FL=1
MKKRLLSILSLLVSQFAFAQTWVYDSVSTGTSYANDVYYSMDNGATKTVANNNWHIAFQMAPQFGPSASASIIANHGVDSVNVKVFSLNLSATAKFATLTASDTIGKTNPERELVGSNKTWNIGAFNKNKDQSNLFDYGWGKYNQTTNNLSGDSIYLVKIGTTTAYKIWVQEYISHPADSISWKVRIATFSGNSDTTLIIPRNKAPYNFTDRLFAYVNLGTYAILDREPSKSNWDLLFTRYKDTATQMGLTLTMNVSGVLQHPNVSVAKVPGAGMPSSSSLSYLDSINTIGYDWKYLAGLTHDDLLAADTSAGIATSHYIMGQDDIAGVIIVPGGYNPDAVEVYLNGVMLYYDAAGLGNTGISDYGSADISSSFIALNGQNIKIRSGKYKNDDIVTVKSYSNSLVAQTPSYKRYSITAYDALAAIGLGYTNDNPGQYIIRANFDTEENNTFVLTDFGAPEGLEFLYNGTQVFVGGLLLTPTDIADLTAGDNYSLITDSNGQLNTLVINPGILATNQIITVVLFTNELGILLPWEGQDSVKSRGGETWLNTEAEIDRTDKIGFISIPATINDMTEEHDAMSFAPANKTAVVAMTITYNTSEGGTDSTVVYLKVVPTIN